MDHAKAAVDELSKAGQEGQKNAKRTMEDAQSQAQSNAEGAQGQAQSGVDGAKKMVADGLDYTAQSVAGGVEAAKRAMGVSEPTVRPKINTSSGCMNCAGMAGLS